MNKSHKERMEMNCIRYEHVEGFPEPGTPDSCIGCRYSIDPNLENPGCTLPDGPFLRDQGESELTMTPDEERKYNKALKEANEMFKTSKPYGIIYRKSKAPC